MRKFECLYSFNHSYIGKSKFYFFFSDKRENTKGDNGIMKNDRPKRLSEEIKKNSKKVKTYVN